MLYMLDNEILTRRLVHIKHLYKIGVSQSYQNESIAIFSLLAFHDSIEMFLKLLSEHKDIDSSKFNFLEYWDKIPSLTLKESMRNLNARRVNLKHKGLLPAKSEIEISRVNTTDFFEQNTVTHFGVEFKNIAMVELVSYETVKDFLKKSQSALDEGNYVLCAENVAYAFDELLHVYDSNKSSWGNSPFYFGRDMTFMSAFSIKPDDKKMERFIDSVKESVDGIRGAIKILSYGLNYREYLKFQILTPKVIRFVGGGRQAQIFRDKKWDKENCQYCIDFVINSSLTLQEFDFDIAALEEKMEMKIERIEKSKK